MRDKTEFDLRAEGKAVNWEPRCLWECGILPAPAHADRPRAPPQETASPGAYDMVLDGGNVYTDGSAVFPKDYNMRRAGYGVWIGANHGANFSGALAGPVQTAYRAELRAMVHAAEHIGGTYTIVSDCKGVVNI